MKGSDQGPDISGNYLLGVLVCVSSKKQNKIQTNLSDLKENNGIFSMFNIPTV